MADWEPVPLPFLKIPSQLPAPLPTQKEILESETVFIDMSNRRVVAVGPHFVVKYGKTVSEIEGQTLLFLEKNSKTCLTVPKLYAMYRTLSTGDLCLVMERLHGETLEVLWPTLTEEEKSTICTKLKDAINFLRGLPAPGFYGGIGETCIPFHLFWDPKLRKELCGPFNSEAEFNAGMVGRLRDNDEHFGGHIKPKTEFYERNLDTMLSGHSPVFTHSDLQRKNIMICRQPESKFEVAIIDWEAAGWYPSYWEYSLKFAGMEWVDDWPKQLEQVVDPWPCESAALRMLYQDLWF